MLAQELDLIYRSSPMGLAVLDRQLRYVRANKALAEMHGCEASDMVGRTLREVVPDLADALEPVLREVLRTGNSVLGGTVSGATAAEPRIQRYFRHDYHALRDPGGLIIGVSVLVHDETELMRGRRLEREVLAISERERHLVGVALHDQVGQQLTGIRFLIEVLVRRLRDGRLPEATDAARIAELVDEASLAARDLARGLYSADRMELGLLPAFKDLASRMEHLYGISCSVEGEDVADSVPANSQPPLFRIAQEAVLNAIKHGRPSKVVIRLTRANGRTTLTVEDDGSGMRFRKRSNTGMGLALMRYRAALLDGDLSLRSSQPHGTIVECSFPSRAGK